MPISEPEVPIQISDNDESSSTIPDSELTLETPYVCMTKNQAFSLYTSHFLSTWNTRTYEFAAVIFTASAYPETLTAAAVRGIVRTLASICFSSAIGRRIDNGSDRLKTLLSTISINRIAVISSSALWFCIVKSGHGDASFDESPSILKGLAFTVILVLGIFEGLSASGNVMSMERDWVVTAASPDGQVYDLSHLNSVMRRIDLICKLVSPLVISAIISVTSTRIGVLVVGSMSAASWGAEIWSARRVWNQNPRLKAPKDLIARNAKDSSQSPAREIFSAKFAQAFRRYCQDFKTYFSSTVWIPSLSLALLHLSALSYSATFITFLLSVGFSLELITIARAAGSLVEISSTVITPVGVQFLGKARHHGLVRAHEEFRPRDESDTPLMGDIRGNEVRTETGLERLGAWGLSWQLLNLIPVVFTLWLLSSAELPSTPSLLQRFLTPLPSQPQLAFVLFFFLSISRLGLWVYDLCAQQLTQTMTLPTQRSSFTGVEYSFISVFEMGQNMLTIVLHRPEQFKWIAVISWLAIATSTIAYAGWVWKMRGHLVHWEKFGKGMCKC